MIRPNDLQNWLNLDVTNYGDWLSGRLNDLFGAFHGREDDFPPMNVTGNDDEVLVRVELPGLEAKDVTLSVDGDTLTLEGGREAEALEEGENWLARERGYGRFARSFRLTHDVDEDGVKARFEHGVLQVSLPRKAETKPKKITVAND